MLRLCKASRVFGQEVIMRKAAQKSVSPLTFTFIIHLLKEIALLTCLKSLVTAGHTYAIGDEEFANRHYRQKPSC